MKPQCKRIQGFLASYPSFGGDKSLFDSPRRHEVNKVPTLRVTTVVGAGHARDEGA